MDMDNTPKNKLILTPTPNGIVSSIGYIPGDLLYPISNSAWSIVCSAMRHVWLAHDGKCLCGELSRDAK